MQTTNYPQLLITNRLIAPLRHTEKVLNDIKNELNGTSMTKELFKNGSFVMAISSFEVSLNDSLKYFLIWFPQKLPEGIFKFKKDVFFDNYYALLSTTIDQFIGELSYMNFFDYFKNYLIYLALEWTNEDLVDNIKEIIATRNLLLHNDLVVNNHYLQSAGIQARGKKANKLKISNDYLLQSIESIQKIIQNVIALIQVKYNNYTVVNANKKLWEFMFHSPVMQYDDYWQYDVIHDNIFARKDCRYEGNLSSTESLCLALWRNHFNGSGGELLHHFDMRRFDAEKQEKVLFFLSIADDFNFE